MKKKEKEGEGTGKCFALHSSQLNEFLFSILGKGWRKCIAFVQLNLFQPRID